MSAVAYFPDISKFRLDSPFATAFLKNADGTYTFSVRALEVHESVGATGLADLARAAGFPSAAPATSAQDCRTAI